MSDSTPSLSEISLKLKGCLVTPAEPGQADMSKPCYDLHDWTSSSVAHSRLNHDVVVKISEYLLTTGDKLALAMTSRWNYNMLGHTIYTYLILSRNTKIDSLVGALVANKARCNVVTDMNVTFPLPYYAAKLIGENLTEEAYNTRQQRFTEGIFIILKLAAYLKCLHIPNFGESAQSSMVNKWLQDPYSFHLRSLSIQTAEGTAAFLERQHQLAQLTLVPSIEPTELPEPPKSSLNFPCLKELWAAPWWCSFILPSAPVQSIVLLRDESIPQEDTAWSDCVEVLIAVGGHKTITSLALPYELLFIFWDIEQLVDLSQYAKAFPNATKLGVLPPGLGAGYFDDTESALDGAKRLVDIYAKLPFPAVRELVFLRPEDGLPNPYSEPYQVQQIGEDCEADLLATLEILLPSLKHVDFMRNCYRKIAEGDTWDVCSRACQY
ncbi:hypothetical protein FRC09_006010 [Ceratobasidium sp. 395]|nr:hypothetical protein FRC09_006010 [Ceratobasidium sp. 395]